MHANEEVIACFGDSCVFQQDDLVTTTTTMMKTTTREQEQPGHFSYQYNKKQGSKRVYFVMRLRVNGA